MAGRPALTGLVTGAAAGVARTVGWAATTVRAVLTAAAATAQKAACGHHWHLRLAGRPRFTCCWCGAATEYTAAAVDGRADCQRPGAGYAARHGRGG